MKPSFLVPRPLPFLKMALAVFGVAFSLNTGICRADNVSDNASDNDTDQPGEQILTRGPVHEAFAGVIAFKPVAGVVVPKAPPEMIQEVPPDQKPEGDNVTWIPGYWAWDDERNDFLWVSGIWRALPPGRQWVTGYWAQSHSGYQWISGYWADANDSQTTYLPPPPASLEDGPDVAAPADDYVWIPGSWVWVEGQYDWQPGYWVEGQDDWDWNPDYYVWTPRGYVFVGGYWDYSIERRGVLFAPVYFDPGVCAQPGFSYSPTVAIDLSVLPNHLFLRPGYSHYYFGDYYDASYSDEGFYADFSFESGGYGYDPIFVHQHWQHRNDAAWMNHIQTKYQARRDHKIVRPPRTWVAQRGAAKNVTLGAASENPPVATSFTALSKTGNPRPFQPLAGDQKQQFVQRSQEVKQSRDMRRTLETNSASPGAQAVSAQETARPFTVARPPSPIMSRPANLPQREQAPPRPPRNRDPGPGPGRR